MNALLHERIAHSAARHPDSTAVAMDGDDLTYAELEELAGRIAAQLVAHDCRPGDRVCLFLSKAPATIAAMLGALEAGCVYVPVDLASPPARLARVVRATEPRLVLADAGSVNPLDALLHASVLDPTVPIGTTGGDPLPGALIRTAFTARDTTTLTPMPPVRVPSDHPAHILFTSGSTGQPKGVVITHANVAAFLDWAIPHFGIAPGDRTSGHPPLHFDLSTFDVYGSLAAGAQLCLVPPRTVLPHEIARFISDEELTQWFSVPSAMTFMAKFDAVPDEGFPSLRRVIWCGEVLPTPVLAHWMRRLPHVPFTNLYGPTEATIASSYHTVTDPPSDLTAPIPIGCACDGEELLVLDSDLRPIQDGEIGQLCIAGAGLSPGYWRDDANTESAFLPFAAVAGERIYRTGDLAKVEDGVVWFLGREDTQIKSRGYRIELGEIEAALVGLEEVGEGAVVGSATESFEGVTICCAYAPRAGVEIAIREVKDCLRGVLPTYMLPARWLVLDELPKNANGKIDRDAIRRLFEEQRLATPDASLAGGEC